MKLWDDFRNYFYKKSLAKRIEPTTERSVTNLHDAKSVGIIYDSSVAENDNAVAKFADDLRKQGKIVDVLGFVNDKKTEEKAGVTIFNKKKVSWTKVPNDENVEKFAAKNFDLLFACFTEEKFPLEYIAGISKAKWRVGAYSKGKTDIYDLMINTGGRKDLPYFMEQATQFLNKVKYDSK